MCFTIKEVVKGGSPLLGILRKHYVKYIKLGLSIS